MGKKILLKPLSEDPYCEIGFVTGKTSPLDTKKNFTRPIFEDPHDKNPAWINTKDNPALNSLLKSIKRLFD